jgi:hypothetical protein
LSFDDPLSILTFQKFTLKTKAIIIIGIIMDAPQQPGPFRHDPYRGYAVQGQDTLIATLNERLNVIGDLHPHFQEAANVREGILRTRAQLLQEEIRAIQQRMNGGAGQPDGDQGLLGGMRVQIQRLVHGGRGLIIAAGCALIAGAVACIAGEALRAGNQTAV